MKKGLDVNACYVLSHPLIRIAAEVVINKLAAVRIRVQQLVAIRPLRPLGILWIGALVRVHVRHEGEVIRAKGFGSVVGVDAEEDLDQIAGVEGTQYRGSVVVAGEVRPGWYFWRQGVGNAEEEAA